MIKRPKKQLSDPQHFFLALLFIPLIGFFVYAMYYRADFFVGLTLALLVIIAALFFLRSRLVKRRAEMDLQDQDYHEETNLLDVEIRQKEQAVESLQKKIVNYSQMKGLTEQLSMNFSLSDTTQTLSKEVDKLFGNEDITVILYLFQSRTGELGLSASQKGQLEINVRAKKGDIYDQWVVRNMKPLLIEDTKKDFRFDIERITTEDSRPVGSLMIAPLLSGSKAIGLLRVDSPQGEYFETEDIRLLSTIADMGAIAIENAQLYEHIENLAIRDSLTGLYLRRYLLDRFANEISREMRRKNELSFLMVDLDEFKKYNDLYGHVAGDMALKTVAQILEEMFSEPGNLVCRYGGEEFCVLLPDCSKDDAMELAESLRRKVESKTILVRREKTKITVSIGLASFPRDAQLKNELIQQADLALYKAKSQGRNQVCSA